MCLGLDFSSVWDDYRNNRSVAYVKNFGIEYYEQLYALLADIASVDVSRVKTLSGLGSITSSDNAFVKLLYQLRNNSNAIEVNSILKSAVLDFYPKHFTLDEIQEMVSLPPIIYNAIPRESYVFLAGIVEFLCDKNGIEKPSWVEDGFFYLDSPICIGDESVIGKTYYMLSKRNLFVLI